MDNNSEDALNVIRSRFNINELKISNTYSDGFDADFCTGIIENSQFENTGNDCIDFSGSTVSILNIDIYESGDKGISGGEASSLQIENIHVKGAVTGIAAKDGTAIAGSDIYIENAEFACAAFQKKPEYSGATISLKKVEVIEVQEKVLVELGSVVALNGETFEGKEKIDIEALYSRFK